MKKIALGILLFLGLCVAGSLWDTTAWAACSLKSWNQGDVVRSSDLNNNFSCVNNNTRGSGLPLVGSSDIAPNAVTRLELATPPMLPVGWWFQKSPCIGAGACTAYASSGITSVTETGVGVYNVVIPTRPDITYGVHVTSETLTAANNVATCFASGAFTSTAFTVSCLDNTNTAKDMGFFIEVFDDE